MIILGGTNLISSITGGIFRSWAEDPDISVGSDELEWAIFSAFTNDPVLCCIASGGLHNVEAPSNTKYPYIVFNLPTGMKSNTFSHEKETVLVQFKIYSRRSSSVFLNSVREQLIRVFDDTLLVLASYDTISMRRTISIKTKDEVDEKVWIYLVQYEVELEKK